MVLIDGIVFSLQKYGGISVYFLELFKALEKRRARAIVSIDTPSKQTMSGRFPSLRTVEHSKRALERYRECRIPEGNVSVFHSSYYRRPAKRTVPTVVTVHDFVYERYARGPRRWVHTAQKHAAIRSAQAVICISEATRRDMLEWVGETAGQDVYVVHNGVSEAFAPVACERPERPYVLYVGERRGYKNFRFLLAAMEHLPGIDLCCVGGGAFRKRELDKASPGVRARVKHLGFVDDRVLNEHYNRAICLVYPSSYEGFGIPVVEAMRAGCPVVSARCEAVQEVGGDALTIAESLEPRDIASAILKTTARDYRRKVVLAGLQVAEGFSWSSTHEKTLSVYRALGATLEPDHDRRP